MAREQATQRGRSLGRVVIEMGFVTECGLVAILAEQLGLEFVDLTEASVDASAVALVPETTARRHNCIPISFDEDGRLVLAMADPANVVAVDDIRAMAKRDVRTVVATKADVVAAHQPSLPARSDGGDTCRRSRRGDGCGCFSPRIRRRGSECLKTLRSSSSSTS